MIKFVSDLQQVSFTIKTDHHDITEIVLLKLALSTINQMNIGSLGRGIGRSIQLILINTVGVCTLISKQFDTYCTMTSI